MSQFKIPNQHHFPPRGIHVVLASHLLQNQLLGELRSFLDGDSRNGLVEIISLGLVHFLIKYHMKIYETSCMTDCMTDN